MLNKCHLCCSASLPRWSVTLCLDRSYPIERRHPLKVRTSVGKWEGLAYGGLSPGNRDSCHWWV